MGKRNFPFYALASIIIGVIAFSRDSVPFTLCFAAIGVVSTFVLRYFKLEFHAVIVAVAWLVAAVFKAMIEAWGAMAICLAMIPYTIVVGKVIMKP